MLLGSTQIPFYQSLAKSYVSPAFALPLPVRQGRGGRKTAWERCGCLLGDPCPAQSWGKAEPKEEEEEEFVCHCKRERVPKKTPFSFPRSSKSFANINSGAQVVMQKLFIYYAIKVPLQAKSWGKGVYSLFHQTSGIYWGPTTCAALKETETRKTAKICAPPGSYPSPQPLFAQSGYKAPGYTSYYTYLHFYFCPNCLMECAPSFRMPATAAAKSLQSCLTLCNPTDGSPPGSAVPGVLQARTLEWVAISFSNAWKWKVKVKPCLSLRDPMDCSLPGSSVHGIFQARVLDWVASSFSIRMPVMC